ncbi:electron transport complex subunit RsxG [Alteromonas sp. a30]|uniref:electron transport complex subunit RsxG n=1 Tax=Alteromonas sp. a30 TaxID=2730917 RepID=UPI0022811781|nr:electron transport complex subunit RsxG [Alteromonas sp. a30]MCY7296873.1 electron transport complex subunit RsxG [Alteromonas sp. a30]
MLSNVIVKHGWLLGAFALATSGLIALTHTLTKGKIAEQEQAKLLSTLNKIIPESGYNNGLSNDCILVSDERLSARQAMRVYRARMDGQPFALAAEVISPDGYNGNIKMLVALVDNQTLGGVRVLSHQETPGLGDKVEERISDWITQFNNLPAENVYDSVWAVKKDGGQFDQFTGATITPRAVLKGTKNAVTYLQQSWQASFQETDANGNPYPVCGATS